MIEVGQINTLTIISDNKSEFVLQHPRTDHEVLLNKSVATESLLIDDEVKVFVYIDKNDSLVATIETPYTLVGEYGYLKVVETHKFGDFLDWGIEKDLFIPDTEQRERIALDRKYLVRVCIDERTNKIYATTKINKYIQNSDFDIAPEDKVQIVPVSDEELGYRCIINKKYIGMIYHNEIFQDVYLGMTLEGEVKKIREDGLVDVSLQKFGFKNVLDSKDRILSYLKEIGGHSPLHDKSSPEEIRSTLNMSKKTFKSSIGILYKDKLIVIKKDGIELKGAMPFLENDRNKL